MTEQELLEAFKRYTQLGTKEQNLHGFAYFLIAEGEIEHYLKNVAEVEEEKSFGNIMDWINCVCTGQEEDNDFSTTVMEMAAAILNNKE